MKNIHVMACYTLEKHYHKGYPEDYKHMTRMCLQSFMANLEGVDEHIVLRGKRGDSQSVFKSIFYWMMRTHMKERCNILYTDVDMLCVKETEIFGVFDDFSLFCKGPMGTQTDFGVLYEKLRPFFSTNMVYCPHTMDSRLWDVGEKLFEDWPENYWPYICLVFNSMFFAQKGVIDRFDVEECHIPKYNYQVIDGHPMDDSMEDAHILHFHGTRGSKQVLEAMRSKWRWQDFDEKSIGV